MKTKPINNQGHYDSFFMKWMCEQAKQYGAIAK